MKSQTFVFILINKKCFNKNQGEIMNTPPHIQAVDCEIDTNEREMSTVISYSNRHSRIQYLHLKDYLIAMYPHLKP